jgi:dipeptidase E
MRLLLGSRSLAALPVFLGQVRHGATVIFVPTAANRLDDRAELIALFREPLVEMGFAVRDVDLDHMSGPEMAASLAGADVLFVGGGDPFYLAGRARRCGFDRAVTEAARRGIPYVGMSAGAMIAGPSLAPVSRVSPFDPEPGAPFDGWALTDCVVLPHHDQPGRAARHTEIVRAFEHRYAFAPLRDDEALMIEGDDPVIIDQRGNRYPVARPISRTPSRPF